MWLKQNVDISLAASRALMSSHKALHSYCVSLSTTLTKAKPCWMKDIAFSGAFTDDFRLLSGRDRRYSFEWY